MPRTSPYQIVLSDQERDQLETRARRYTSPYVDVVRAKTGPADLSMVADGHEVLAPTGPVFEVLCAAYRRPLLSRIRVQ